MLNSVAKAIIAAVERTAEEQKKRDMEMIGLLRKLIEEMKKGKDK